MKDLRWDTQEKLIVPHSGSGGGEVVRVSASLSRGHEFEPTWRHGFFLFFFFFFFYQWQSVLNQVPQKRYIFDVWPIFLLYP